MSLMQYLDRQKSNPIFQTILVGLVAFLFMGVVAMVTNNSASGWENVWIVLIMFLLFFALMNSVISLSIEKQTAYFWKSVTCFFGLLVFLLLSAYLLSGVSFYESGFFRWMIVVVVFGYLVLFSIVMAMYRIVKFAQNQDKKLRNEE